MKVKNIKRSLRHEIIIGLIQFTDGVLISAVSSTCFTLSVTGFVFLIVPTASGIGAE